MNGRLGLGLVALGIFVGVLGGFLLNAETVTTCETEWTYLTDVGGAFEGARTDIDERYDPASNATGWSVFDAFNDGRISGVAWDPTDRINAYRVVSGTLATSSGNISVTASDHGGQDPDPDVSIADASGGSYGGSMRKGTGLNNGEAVTVYDHGGTVEFGAFAVSVSQLTNVVQGYSGMSEVTLTAPSVGGYPAFAIVSESSSVMVYRPVSGGASYNVYAAVFTATAYGDTAIIHRQEGTVEIGGQTARLSDALLFWGKAQFNGTGSFSGSVSVAYTAVSASPTAYLDPTKGVMPQAGTYTTSAVEYVYHAGSAEPSFSLEIPLASAYMHYALIIEFEDGSLWQSVMVGQINGEGGTARLSVQPSDSSSRSFDVTGDSVTISGEIGSGTFSFFVNGDAAGSCQMAYPSASVTLVKDLRIVVRPITSADIPACVATVVNDAGTGDVHRFSGGSEREEWRAPLTYSTYEAVDTQHAYDRAYWHNYGPEDPDSNASVTVAFSAGDGSSALRNVVVYRGPSSASSYAVSYDPSSGWSVGGAAVGMWPAIEVVAGYGALVVRPVQAFATFADYQAVGAEIVVDGAFLAGGTVDSMEVQVVSGYGSIRMAVVATVVRIGDGGLFLQDGHFSPSRSFPGSQAVSVMLGSAARMGNSITFSSASASSEASIPVDAEGGRVYVGGAWQPFDGVTFRWVSADMAAQSIGGEQYGAALYHRGQEYDADAIWAELKNGRMFRIADADADWTMTLDGIWAPAVFLYEGENRASEATELSDWTHPQFRWSGSDFILIMMGVSILGGVVASYFRLTDLWDWLAIIGTVGALWLFLG